MSLKKEKPSLVGYGCSGYALLIHNDYQNNDRKLEVLQETREDASCLQRVLTKFKYRIERCSNEKNIDNVLQRFKIIAENLTNGSLVECKSVIIYFSGHGGVDSEDRQFLVLQGGDYVWVDRLIGYLIEGKLASVAKLFLIDACRTKHSEVKSGRNINFRHFDSGNQNVLVAYATLLGKEAYLRNGSHWTTCLVEAYKSTDQGNIDDILRKAHKEMAKVYPKQIPEYENNLKQNMTFTKEIFDAEMKLASIYEIKQQFKKVTEDIKDVLITNKVPAGSLIQQLRKCYAVKIRKIPLYTSDVFKNAESLTALWDVLSERWDAFDYDVLMHIISVLNCPEATSVLQKFQASINPDTIKTLMLYSEKYEVCGSKPIVRVKVNADEISKDDKIQIKKELCKWFSLEEHSFWFKSIKKGCIELLYHTSKEVALYISSEFKVNGKIMNEFLKSDIVYIETNDKRLNVPHTITNMDEIFEWSELSSQEVELTSSSDILQKEPTGDLVAKQPKKRCFDPTDTVKIVVGKDGIAAKKPATIPDFFKETCSKSLHTKAVCWKDSKEVHWQSLTYAKYKELVYAVAKSFLKLGLETYHAVGILGFNSVEWFASSMGAVFAGGLSTGIYTTNSTEVCHYILNSSRANIIVVENQKLLDKILKIRDKLPHLKAIVQYKGELSKDYPDTYTWVKFLELGKDMDDSVIDKIINIQQPNQCAMLVYPDAVGSTDNLKGIMLSHDNITWVTAAYVDAIGEDKLKTHGGEKFISYLPLSHIVPLILDMYLPLYVGGTVYFSQPDALKGSLVITLQDVEPTFFFGVPRVWEKVNETCQNDNWIANAKSTRGIQKQQPYLIVTRQYHAVGLPEPYVWTEKQLFSLKMCKNTIVGVDPTHIIFLDYNTRSMYGVSECTGLQSLETKVSMPKIHMPKIHMPKIPSFVTEWSAGKSIRGVEAKLDCQEVFFRGRHVFMGYLGMEKETKETIDEEGWLHSGDTGNVYENGSLSIYDHMADVITMANEEKIYPAKMENLIKSKLPFLSNVVLIGDNQWYLTCLLTLKCFMDPDTGEATDDLQPQVIEMFQKLGSKCTTVSQVLKTEDKKVFNVIQQGIEFVAFVFHETSKHIIKKWKLLPTDFTMVGEELGPMLNLRRSLVLKKYKKEIETMYSS